MTTILVSSVIANKYRNGGNAWVVLSWLLGLRRLGCNVYFVEQINREHCVDEGGAVTTFRDSVNLAYFRATFERFALADRAALVYNDGEQIHGPARDTLFDLAAEADLLINVTGHLKWDALKRLPRRRLYLDLDPGFTQFWHAAGHEGLNLEGHDFYFTVGENVGTPHCSIPTNGINWRHVRQPVVLDEWPYADAGERDLFTTVGTWRGPYGVVRHNGTAFGPKAHEWRKYIRLPERAHQRFEIALDIHPADEKDLNLLLSHGWKVVSPGAVAADADSFRRYVQNSGAEFSVAQGVYVETESGWFSDRTTRYLASGKPALVQDTGLSRNYPTGEGLLTFRTPEEAATAAESIARDYDRHARAARSLAEEFFDSDKVLGALLEEVGVAP